jgi:hypothetical protein
MRSSPQRTAYFYAHRSEPDVSWFTSANCASIGFEARNVAGSDRELEFFIVTSFYDAIG